jgi:hypothetical protein
MFRLWVKEDARSPWSCRYMASVAGSALFATLPEGGSSIESTRTWMW